MAHALVRSVDADDARAMPGVAGVFAAGDMGGLRMPPVEDSPEVFARPLLAIGRVRFVGEPVAVVVARTRAQAMDAADAVAVDYEPLAPVIDPEAALEPDAPVLFQAHGSNLAIRVDDVASGSRRARGCRDHRAGTVRQPAGGAGADGAQRRSRRRRLSPPGRAIGARCGPRCRRPTTPAASSPRFWGWTRPRCASAPRRWAAAFGGKIPTYPEHVVIAWLARHLGGAVRWAETRTENMVAMTHGRGQVQHVELGATRDGRIRGLRVFVIQDIGAYASEAATLPPLTGLMASGPYRIPRIDFHAVSVVTTTTPVGAYRGAGPAGGNVAAGARPGHAGGRARDRSRGDPATQLHPPRHSPTAPRPAPTTTAGTRAVPSTSRSVRPGTPDLRQEQAARASTGGNVAARHRHQQLRGGHGLGERVRRRWRPTSRGRSPS